MLKKITVIRFIGMLILLFAMSSGSQAGTSTGVITSIVVSSFNNSVTFVAGTHINKPSCHTAPGEQWSFLLSSSNAKYMYAQLLSAASQGRTIEVAGFSCESGVSVELPSIISVNY